MMRRVERVSVPQPDALEATIACTEMGTGTRTLVFLPGLGATSRYWERRVTPLAGSHHLVLVDLLGFGRSPKPWTRYTVERHVEELHRILDGRGPVTIVGHSFGCTVSMAYASRHPEHVSGLVLLSPPYFASEQQAIEHVRGAYAPIGWILTNIGFASVACVVTRRVLGRLLPYLIRDQPRELVEDLVRHTWRSFTSTLWEGIYRYDPGADASHLPARLPVLIIHGDQDRTAPLDGARSLAAIIPGATLRVLRGVDHDPLARRTAWCVDVVREFVTERSRRPRAYRRAHARTPRIPRPKRT